MQKLVTMPHEDFISNDKLNQKKKTLNLKKKKTDK